MKNKPNSEHVIEEWVRLSLLAPRAIRYLSKLTGKVGLANIDPLEEKKWNETAWKHYGILVDLSVIIRDGKLPRVVYDQIIRDIKPTDGWIDHVSTGKFPRNMGQTERFNKVYPKVKN